MFFRAVQPFHFHKEGRMFKRVATELLLLAAFGLMVGFTPLWAQYKADAEHIKTR